MGARLSSTGANAASGKDPTLKRKARESPIGVRLNQDQEANGVRLNASGVPFISLYEARFEPNAPYFQLRKGSKSTSDFTNGARANLVREYAVTRASSSTTGSCAGVLVHYTTTVSAVHRFEKAIALKASSDGDKTNCAMSASIKNKQEDSLPKTKPCCPEKENRHPNKMPASKSTPKKTKTPKKSATPRRTSARKKAKN
jgi:hypothetical protein